MTLREWDYTFKLSFEADWFDPLAQVKRGFLLNFYPHDSTMELYDVGTSKAFLRRSFCDGLQLGDLYVGNLIAIYDRTMTIVAYANEATRRFIDQLKQRTFALVKPSGMPHLGDIFDAIHAARLSIERLRMCVPPRAEILRIYDNLKGNPHLPFIVDHVTSAPIVAMELVGVDAMRVWRDLMGPRDSQEAKTTAPTSLRARFGYDAACNVVHGADSVEKAAEGARFFFPRGGDAQPPANTSRVAGCTCCVVKPHAIADGHLGAIVRRVGADFDVSAIQMFFMTPANLEEFLEVYKGVVTDYTAFLRSYMSGPCAALEISRRDADPPTRDVHAEFRALCGPIDCDVAKNVRPNSLRAMFGRERYMNAIHCTDLPEDCELELEYFFKIMD